MREHDRLLKEVSIRWKNETLEFDDVTLDICPGGVFIVSNRSVPPNTLLDLEVCTRPGCIAKCQGQVAWVNHGQVAHYPPGFGVQFLNLSDEIFNHLLGWCDADPEEEPLCRRAARDPNAT